MNKVSTCNTSEMSSFNFKVLDMSDFNGASTANNSSESFYENELKVHFEDAVKSKRKLIVDLDNTTEYSSTFIDESFGKLTYDFTMKTVVEHLELKSLEEPKWIEFICKDVIPKWENKRVNEYLCDIPEDELKMIWAFENETQSNN